MHTREMAGLLAMAFFFWNDVQAEEPSENWNEI